MSHKQKRLTAFTRITKIHLFLGSSVIFFPKVLNRHSVMDLISINVVMILEVVINQDNILDFPKHTHILSTGRLKFHSWLSETG